MNLAIIEEKVGPIWTGGEVASPFLLTLTALSHRITFTLPTSFSAATAHLKLRREGWTALDITIETCEQSLHSVHASHVQPSSGGINEYLVVYKIDEGVVNIGDGAVEKSWGNVEVGCVNIPLFSVTGDDDGAIDDLSNLSVSVVVVGDVEVWCALVDEINIWSWSKSDHTFTLNPLLVWSLDECINNIFVLADLKVSAGSNEQQNL